MRLWGEGRGGKTGRGDGRERRGRKERGWRGDGDEMRGR